MLNIIVQSKAGIFKYLENGERCGFIHDVKAVIQKAIHYKLKINIKWLKNIK